MEPRRLREKWISYFSCGGCAGCAGHSYWHGWTFQGGDNTTAVAANWMEYAVARVVAKYTVTGHSVA
jgi:hypothetical protein